MRCVPQTLRRSRLPRFVSLVLLVAAVGALSVPVAQADRWGASRASAGHVNLRPDDRSGTRTVASASAPRGIRPNDRGGSLGPTGGIRGLGPVTPPIVSDAKTVVVRVDDFQWLDAGIGAATTIAAGILAAGIVLVARRQRTAPRPI
jgi:hypothetical protein